MTVNEEALCEPLKRMLLFTYSIWRISHKSQDDRIRRSLRIFHSGGESNLMQMSFIRSGEHTSTQAHVGSFLCGVWIPGGLLPP